MANAPITQRITVKGEVLIRMEGSDDLHKVGSFDQQVDVTLTATPYPADPKGEQ